MPAKAQLDGKERLFLPCSHGRRRQEPSKQESASAQEAVHSVSQGNKACSCPSAGAVNREGCVCH